MLRIKTFNKTFQVGKTVVQLDRGGEWYSLERVGAERTLIRVAGFNRALRRDQVSKFSNVKQATV